MSEHRTVEEKRRCSSQCQDSTLARTCCSAGTLCQFDNWGHSTVICFNGLHPCKTTCWGTRCVWWILKCKVFC